MSVIRLERVSVTYTGFPRPALANVNLEIDEGVLCVVAGATGSGKSTLLGAITGKVPHFTGGRLDGRVLVGGRDTRTHPPREIADLIGFVGQDPLAGFVADRVEDELAYSMEQLAVPAATMRTRVEQMLDLLGIAELRNRPLRTLSGGQQQRVAIGAALAADPRDPRPRRAHLRTRPDRRRGGARRDHAPGARPGPHGRSSRSTGWNGYGYADHLVHGRRGEVASGAPEAILQGMTTSPPIVDLAGLVGWSPVPLSSGSRGAWPGPAPTARFAASAGGAGQAGRDHLDPVGAAPPRQPRVVGHLR